MADDFSQATAAAGAKADPAPQLIFGVDKAGEMPTLDRVQFIYLGHNYCWYDGGWQGPGFYWCGYAWRHGFGWGGGSGWHGWHGGGWRGGINGQKMRFRGHQSHQRRSW